MEVTKALREESESSRADLGHSYGRVAKAGKQNCQAVEEAVNARGGCGLTEEEQRRGKVAWL